MKQILEQSANTIEYVLHQHGIDARVDGGVVSPRLFTFDLTLPPQVKRSRVNSLTEKIASEMGVASCRLTLKNGQPVLEVPRPDPSTVRLLPLYQRLDSGEFGDQSEIPGNTCLLGLDTDGSPLLLRLDGEGVGNVLLIGQASGGKSQLLRSMISSLALASAPEEVQLLLIDSYGKSNALRQLEGLPHLLRPIITDALDAVHHLRWLARHIEYREEQNISSPTIVVAIDDAQPLLSKHGQKFRDALTVLCQRGPDVGIHVLLANRRPDDAIMGDSLRSNFSTRVVLRAGDAEEARQMVGTNGSGAEKLLGLGDALVVIGKELVRMQAAMISDSECRQLVGLLAKVQRDAARDKQAPREEMRPRDLSARKRASVQDDFDDDEQEQPVAVTRIHRPVARGKLRAV